MLLLVLAATAAAVLVVARRRRDGDLPQRLVVAATGWLPASRSTWGPALVAELAAVHGRLRRWRFALGVARTAAFPPAANPGTARATAAIGTATTVALTIATLHLLPTLTVFVATLGLLTCGWATARARRGARPPTGGANLAAATVTVLGLLSVVGTVVVVAAAHPAATRDGTHVFSVILAATLAGYLVAGTTRNSAGPAPAAAAEASAQASARVSARVETTGRVVAWTPLAAATAAVAATVALPSPEAVAGLVPPTTAIATLAAAILVSAGTRTRPAGTRAGLLVAVLATPVQFAVTTLALQYAHPAALTDPYDVAAYPHSGYPDVASYLLSDTLAGNVVSLAATPVILYAVAAIGAAAPRLVRR